MGGMREEGCYKNISNAAARTWIAVGTRAGRLRRWLETNVLLMGLSPYSPPAQNSMRKRGIDEQNLVFMVAHYVDRHPSQKPIAVIAVVGLRDVFAQRPPGPQNTVRTVFMEKMVDEQIRK